VAKENKPVAKETKPAPKEAKEEKSVARPSGKPGFFQRIGDGIKRYVGETSGELKKVSWPTRREAWYLTVIVLVVTGIMALVLGSFDYLFSKLFEWILQLPI
jgi:preprotein translocase subunit SecE